MKANHNLITFNELCRLVVVNISISKNESKSQQYATIITNSAVVVNISISKNESKSQLCVSLIISKYCCGKYQYFKE